MADIQNTVLFSEIDDDAVASPTTNPYPFALTPDIYPENDELFKLIVVSLDLTAIRQRKSAYA